MSETLTTGVDILDVARIQKSLQTPTFTEKVFHQEEIDYCAVFANPYPHYAGFFCAKEAVAKALGVGIGASLAFKDIHISHDEKGAPLVTLSSKAAKHFSHPRFSLSIAHEKTYAVAFVIKIG